MFSRENYKLDVKSDIIKVLIEVTTADGTRLTVIKYLTRFDRPHDAVPTHYPENSSYHHHNYPSSTGNVPFIHSINTIGWKLFEFWPSTMLSGAKVRILRAIRIRTQNFLTNEPAKLLEILWESPNCPNDFDYRLISRSISGKNNESEEVVEFVIQVRFVLIANYLGNAVGNYICLFLNPQQVTLGESTWVISHRYREFDALRKFLLAQNPFTSQFQVIDSKFPGKTITMAIRKNVLERRVEGLESYLAYYLENARYCRQNSIDALCSFLQVGRVGKLVS
jgi:hypothetical protein